MHELEQLKEETKNKIISRERIINILILGHIAVYFISLLVFLILFMVHFQTNL